MGGEGGKEGECEEESLTATVSRQTRAGENTDFTEWVDLNDLAINPKNPMSCSSWQILSWKRKIVTCVTFVMTEQTIHNFCIIEKMVPTEEEFNPQKNSKNKCLSFKIFLPENEQQNIVQIKYRWARGELQQPIGRGVKNLCPEGKPVQGRRANFSKDWPLTFCNNQ